MNTVSFVFQSSRLVKDTVLENVRLSNPQATREEAINALNAAQCADIIEKLPNGIDTVIGADGVYLSGGEQQRIAIARAILKTCLRLCYAAISELLDANNSVTLTARLFKRGHADRNDA